MSKAPITLPLVLAAAAFVLSTSLLAQDRPQSLRGATPITDTAKVEQYQRGPDQGPIPRDYVQQPPLIPHKIDGYRIDLNFNKCVITSYSIHYTKLYEACQRRSWSASKPRTTPRSTA